MSDLDSAPRTEPTYGAQILDGGTRAPVDAVIVEGVGEVLAEAVDSAWQAAMRNLLTRVGQKAHGAYRIPEHVHWSWRRKVAAHRAAPNKTVFFALQCRGTTEGMMAVTAGLPCRVPRSGERELVFVDYISTAPWNLADVVALLGEAPRYRAVGTALLSAAVAYSLREGFDGIMGLYALPQANRFYRDACGMTDLGYDAAHRMRYFEFTEQQAIAFLGEGA